MPGRASASPLHRSTSAQAQRQAPRRLRDVHPEPGVARLARRRLSRAMPWRPWRLQHRGSVQRVARSIVPDGADTGVERRIVPARCLLLPLLPHSVDTGARLGGERAALAKSNPRAGRLRRQQRRGRQPQGGRAVAAPPAHPARLGSQPALQRRPLRRFPGRRESRLAPPCRGSDWPEQRASLRPEVSLRPRAKDTRLVGGAERVHPRPDTGHSAGHRRHAATRTARRALLRRRLVVAGRQHRYGQPPHPPRPTPQVRHRPQPSPPPAQRRSTRTSRISRVTSQ